MDSGCLATACRCTGGGTCGDTRQEAVCLGSLERADVN